MSGCSVANNALLVVNYTGQDVNLRRIKVKRDADGNSILDKNGNYIVTDVSSAQVITPSINDGSDGVRIVDDWGPASSGKYDGYTAQTKDGKYSITAALADGPNAFGYNQGGDIGGGVICYNAWVYLCTDDGSGANCVNSNGVVMTGAPYASSGAHMSPSGKYVTRGPISWWIIILVVIVVGAIIAVGGYFGYKHYHK